MAAYFFPGCKVTAQFKEASRRAKQYVEERHGMQAAGCCRPNHRKLAPGDAAVVVCNNCAAIIEENTSASITSLWQVVDQDPGFRFPDHHGEEVTIQDCWIAFERRDVQDAVRSLLGKMRFTVVELEEHHEATRFCGVNLLSPCTESNAALARRRYVERFPHMFTPMEPDAQVAHFRKHCAQIATEKVVCCCKFCTDAINMGGKKGMHILELLFPDQADRA